MILPIFKLCLKENTPSLPTKEAPSQESQPPTTARLHNQLYECPSVYVWNSIAEWSGVFGIDCGYILRLNILLQLFWFNSLLYYNKNKWLVWGGERMISIDLSSNRIPFWVSLSVDSTQQWLVDSTYTTLAGSLCMYSWCKALHCRWTRVNMKEGNGIFQWWEGSAFPCYLYSMRINSQISKSEI